MKRNKLEFILALHEKLSCLPQEDLEERLAFYNEMIDDRMEEGLPEAEAVAQIGSADEVASQVIADTPLLKLVKEKIKPKKRRSTWQTVLLVLGSPVWLSLLIAALAVLICLYAVLWAVVICFWAVFASVTACAPAGVLSGAMFCYEGHIAPGIAMIAAGLVCAGLAIFLFWGCKALTKGAAWLTKNSLLAIKRSFMKKEEK